MLSKESWTICSLAFANIRCGDIREALDENIAYWTPTDDPLKGKTLIYVIEHASRDAAIANWKAFGEDPNWISVRDKSEANGKLVEKVDSTFMVLTDFSPRV